MKRTCGSCRWLYWDEDRCIKSGQIRCIDDRACSRHETKEEWEEKTMPKFDVMIYRNTDDGIDIIKRLTGIKAQSLASIITPATKEEGVNIQIARSAK